MLLLDSRTVTVAELLNAEWRRRRARNARYGRSAFARDMGVSNSAMGTYLEGKQPSEKNCVVMAERLGMEPEELLRLAGRLPPAINQPEVEIHPDLQVRLKLFTPEEQKRWVIPAVELARTLRDDSGADEASPPPAQSPPQPPSTP